MINSFPTFSASTKRAPNSAEQRFAHNVLANTQALMRRIGCTYEQAFARVTNGLPINKYLSARFIAFDAIQKRDWSAISQSDIEKAIKRLALKPRHNPNYLSLEDLFS